MHSLIKLNQTIQIKRIEGKAALEQCRLAKQALTVTSNRFVRENPWTTLGISALAAIAVAKAKRLAHVTSSISSIRWLLNDTLALNDPLSPSSSSPEVSAPSQNPMPATASQTFTDDIEQSSNVSPQ